MNKFNTFDEVVLERKRLEADLLDQKEFIRTELLEIRNRLNPVVKVLSFFSRIGHSNNSTAGTLLKIGSNVGLDLLIGHKLKKAGWLAKLALPLVMKFTANRAANAARKS
jgi:hypothetical protein